MSGYVSAVVHFAQAYAGLVYALAFVATCLESIAVFGLLVPGSGVIVALGALVPSGAIGFWWLALCSILGALAGDGISYWVGRAYRDRLTRIWPFKRYPQILAQGERFFAAHGGKSVFLARFVAPVRGTVPVVAGMAGMAPARFFTINAISAAGWAPAHILPGMVIGAGLTLTGAMGTRLLIVVVVLAGLIWLAAIIAKMTIRRGLPLLVRLQRQTQIWAGTHRGWLPRLALALLDPSRGEARALAVLGLVLIAAAWTFFATLEDVATGEPLVRVDSAIYNMLQSLRSVIADRVMIAITELGSATVLGTLSAAVLLWLAWRRAWHAAAYWVAAAGGASLLALIIKATLHRPRPAAMYSGWDAFSFPSGHATGSAAVLGFLGILLARGARPAWQVAIATMVATAVGLVGLSRLYLGAHWFSDVVGGIAFGTAWIALLAISYVRHNERHLPRMPLVTIAVLSFAAVGTFQIVHKTPADLEKYARPESTKSLNASYWWHEGWYHAPLWRVDLIGEREEPFSLQWAGSLAALQDALAAAGWKAAKPWSVEATLDAFGLVSDAPALPVLPRLHDGRLPALTLVHAGPGDQHSQTRWVLRLWETGTKLTSANDGARPLYAGAITLQHLHRALAPFDLGFESSPARVPWNLLRSALHPSRLATRVEGTDVVEIMLAYDSAGRRLSDAMLRFPRAGKSA
jgi:membrane protein DedA with SNARE-associated domain/membrane-associated phospholipid phosphatase